MTPAQQMILELVDRNNASALSNRTNRSTNEVHAGAARSLIRQGILEAFAGPDGTYVRRPTPEPMGQCSIRGDTVPEPKGRYRRPVVR